MGANKGVTLISELRASDAVEEELEWFFCCAESEMGLRSSWEPLVAMAHFGVVGTRSDPADVMTDRRIEAARAERIIRERLGAIDPEHVRALMAAYEPRRWPARVAVAFGRLAGIAASSEVTVAAFYEAQALQRTHAKTPAEWLDEQLAHGGRRAVAEMKLDAQSRWIKAVGAYRAVRGTGPSVAPKEEET